ncbi:N-formylglutamate amidohydrolase [Pseudomonas knackmussii]|uniref:N-formylglutamate amidohydrolase n=1 Tax=Pseudomonas knackmussii TaxID=65741 RepID=UPI003BDF55C8
MSQSVTIDVNEIAYYAGDAVSVTPGDENADIVLLCEHGGGRIPAAWNNLGLPEAFLATHFCQDLGSRELTLSVAKKLGATGIVSNYSRLFLDYNRKKYDPGCIRVDMGGIPIPGNINLSEAERDIRERIARHPVESAVADWVEGKISRAKAIISIHSFSPLWDNDFRSCEVGVMWKGDDGLPLRLINAIGQQDVFRVDDNEPYSFKENDWFTLDRHGISVGVPNAYIEVRNDLIQSDGLVDKMSDVLVKAIERSCLAF